MRNAHWILAILVALGIEGALGAKCDCASETHESDLDFISAQLRNSVSFCAYKNQVQQSAYFVDSEAEDYWIVVYGEDRDTHFVRGGTLKIFRSGRIMRCALDVDAYELDVPDAPLQTEQVK